jgi:hypothetical protein
VKKSTDAAGSVGVLEQLRAMPEFAQAVEWGWLMQTGELTGTGARHAGGLTKGIARDQPQGVKDRFHGRAFLLWAPARRRHRLLLLRMPSRSRVLALRADEAPKDG